MVNSSIYRQIEKVVNDLDIHKIRMVLEYLGWEWSDGIPTQSEIYDTAIEVLEMAYSQFRTELVPAEIYSGGFRATCSLDDQGNHVFKIVFELTSADNCAP